MGLVEVIPLGGAGEIGKNCTVIRQGEDLIVVDCGLSFPNEEMPGVDIVIPDFTFLLENRDQIRGIFLTHAHEDHVGALPYLLREVDCPVFAGPFTQAMIAGKLEERAASAKLDLRELEPGNMVEVGSLKVESVPITHSIPESVSIAVHTEHGVVLVTGDFKFDFSPVDGKLSNLQRFAELGAEGVVCLLSDSTNIERPGWGPSEREVYAGLRQQFADAPGRILLTTFASSIHRLQQVFTVAAETGRKVATAGRRMETTIEVASRMGKLRVPPGIRIALDQVGDYRADQLVILTTGSQGEPMSALVQMSKEEYGRLRIEEGDTVLYSARPIPGNEAAIWRTINRLFRMGARVVYDSHPPIHVSGHGHREELRMMINLVRPYYLAPVHGEPRHQHRYAEMAREMGFPEHRVFMLEDGRPLCLDETKAWLGDPVPCGRVLVDASGQPGVSDDVLRDRGNLAKHGIVVVTIAVDIEQGEIVGQPTVQAKGVSASPELLDAVTDAVADVLESMSGNDRSDPDAVRHAAADVARKFLQRRGQIRPLVVPVVVEI